MAWSSDTFDAGTAQNLKSGGDGAKSNNWYARNTANCDAMDVNSSNAGKLTIDVNATNSGISATAITAPYAYQLVAGDFDIETEIIDNNDQDFEQAGLLVVNDSNEALHLYITNYYGSGDKIACRSSNGT